MQVVLVGGWFPLGLPTRNTCQDLDNLAKRSMQDDDIKNRGRIRPERGTIFIPDICVVHARS